MIELLAYDWPITKQLISKSLSDSIFIFLYI